MSDPDAGFWPPLPGERDEAGELTEVLDPVDDVLAQWCAGILVRRAAERQAMEEAA